MNTLHWRSIKPKFVILPAFLLVAVLSLCFSFSHSPEQISLPILLYHEINASGEGDSIIAQDVFLSHLDALQDSGYQTVSLSQIIAFVEHGEPLPPKPVLITFDDGYLSNYQIAWPALQERGMVGTIFVIGHSVGQNTYKDTGVAITPHFSYEQAREMVDSGVMSIQSHTYDLHQFRPLEPCGGREGVLSKEGESDADYRRVLRRDFQCARDKLSLHTGQEVLALAYPYGLYTPASEEISLEEGISVTLTTQAQTAHLRSGDLGSLRLLGRYTIDDCTPYQLLTYIQANL
ncbi:MAG: polysaccharide deacetylase family protein [Lawsonibacter sp.]|jgi:peptidoglycan/xylan/chitin deacetylase (PgdA/CDA1 family)